MSVPRVPSNVVAGFRFPQPTRIGNRTSSGAEPPVAPAPSAIPSTQAQSNDGVSAASPPPGTDPALWDILTADERAFFARLGAMGPLTYGRALQSAATPAPLPRGTRLDVRG